MHRPGSVWRGGARDCRPSRRLFGQGRCKRGRSGRGYPGDPWAAANNWAIASMDTVLPSHRLTRSPFDRSGLCPRSGRRPFAAAVTGPTTSAIPFSSIHPRRCNVVPVGPTYMIVAADRQRWGSFSLPSSLTAVERIVLLYASGHDWRGHGCVVGRGMWRRVARRARARGKGGGRHPFVLSSVDVLKEKRTILEPLRNDLF